MDACLATKTHYVDTANYEPEDTAKNLSTAGSGRTENAFGKGRDHSTSWKRI